MTPGARRPGESDFDPYGGDLDAQSAWRHFGGLTLDAAYARFCENPLVYQEDFMFMGPRAFRYYFAVIERYVRAFLAAGDATDDGAIVILSHAIDSQLAAGAAEGHPELRTRIAELCAEVAAGVDGLAGAPADRRRIARGWATLAERG